MSSHGGVSIHPNHNRLSDKLLDVVVVTMSLLDVVAVTMSLHDIVVVTMSLLGIVVVTMSLEQASCSWNMFKHSCNMLHVQHLQYISSTCQ